MEVDATLPERELFPIERLKKIRKNSNWASGKAIGHRWKDYQLEIPIQTVVALYLDFAPGFVVS